MRRRYFIPFTLSVFGFCWFASDSIAQTAIQKQEGDDQDGIVSTVRVMPDVSGTYCRAGAPPNRNRKSRRAWAPTGKSMMCSSLFSERTPRSV